MDEAPEVRSGANGRFLIRDVPAGTRQIEVLALGMRPVATAVDVVANDTLMVALTLHRIPTLEAMRARNNRGGFCMASLYVDGRWERDQEELHWLRTDDIATMEVHPRASMTPSEFVPPTREPCGAVVIWTKHTFR